MTHLTDKQAAKLERYKTKDNIAWPTAISTSVILLSFIIKKGDDVGLTEVGHGFYIAASIIYAALGYWARRSWSILAIVLLILFHFLWIWIMGIQKNMMGLALLPLPFYLIGLLGAFHKRSLMKKSQAS
jgi:lipid-A-disaccharide synthase-like uncharacterized protein